LPPGFPAVPQYLCHATVRLPARSSRTWSVTPSGSRPEPFAVEQGSESSALSTPRVRLPPQRRVCRAPPQGRARRRRETRGHGGHGQSPRGVGPCFTRALSRAATRNADRALPGVTARMGGSDFHAHRPCPRFYACSRVPASRGPMRGSPWLPRVLNVRLDTASDPGEYPCRSPERDTDCCLPAGQTRRHSRPFFSGLNTFRVGFTRYLAPRLLSCLRMTRLLPVTPQGSILGSRLTITQAGLAPARTRGLARPHCPFSLSFFLPRTPPRTGDAENRKPAAEQLPLSGN
jgi:hypothetical protein